jgi:hypothetical protein
MASEQNTGAMGILGGGFEQDKAMGGPVAGQEEQAPKPLAPPPLRIDTAYQFGGGGGGPWTGATPPTAAPQKDSRKSHVAKPDPFKDRRDFNKFNQSAYLYTVANPGEFPDDKSKVMFYLSYMEGLPGQFAENIVQRMMDYEARGLKIDLEFEEFTGALTSTFGDVNKRATAQEQLLRSYQGKMPAEAFFQMFEQRVWAAKYEYGHNKYLIQVLKRALNREVVDMIYVMQELPKSWEKFQDAAIHFNK